MERSLRVGRYAKRHSGKGSAPAGATKHKGRAPPPGRIDRRFRVSELLYVKGRPVALLDWVNVGGLRTPFLVCELDPSKLHPRADPPGLFDYAGVTTDPRFSDNLNR